jgi:chaperone modulatory protein CbpM
MNSQEFIPIDVFCRHYGVEDAFVISLQDYGLIEIIQVNEIECLEVNQLVKAEKLVRLHRELAINTEGLEVVVHLLQRIQQLEVDMISLRNRLSLYEP